MNWLGFLIGTGFGFVIVAARLHDYNVIHDALLFRDFYVWLLMASGVGTAAPLLYLLRRRRWQTPLGGPLDLERRPVQRKHVLGSMVFGAGWAVSGTCPGPALAMTVGGSFLGAFVMAGLFAGVLLREAVASRAARAAPGAASPAAAPADAPRLEPAM